MLLLTLGLLRPIVQQIVAVVFFDRLLVHPGPERLKVAVVSIYDGVWVVDRVLIAAVRPLVSTAACLCETIFDVVIVAGLVSLNALVIFNPMDPVISRRHRPSVL